MKIIVTIDSYVDMKHGGFLFVFARILILLSDYNDTMIVQMCHRLQAMEAISPKLLLSLLPILWLTTHRHTWAHPVHYFGKGVHA